MRHVFERYLALGNVRQLETELKGQGIIAPARATIGGKPIGGVPFSRGTLYLMLKRITYTGRIAHGDKVYPGNHPPIIDIATFDAVQAMLADNTQGQAQSRSERPSLLAGRIVDQAGDPLVATHATKSVSTHADAKTVRYRYYISHALHHKQCDTGMRVPAREIETLVSQRVATLFDDPVELVASAWLDVPADRYGELHTRCPDLAAQQRQRSADTLVLVRQVQVHDSRVDVICDISAIAAALELAPSAEAPETITLSEQVRLTRTGRAMRLVQGGGHVTGTTPDQSLTKLLVHARRWWGELKQGEIDITRLAAREKVSAAYITRVIRLAFLSPDVTQAILAGRQRAGVTAKALTLEMPIAACWKRQASVMLPVSTARR